MRSLKKIVFLKSDALGFVRPFSREEAVSYMQGNGAWGDVVVKALHY
jgi:hypothetical protein